MMLVCEGTCAPVAPPFQGQRGQCPWAIACGGTWCPALPFEIGAHPFCVWPASCYIHPIVYFKNVAPLLGFGPS